jgi:hypothetical protein
MKINWTHPVIYEGLGRGSTELRSIIRNVATQVEVEDLAGSDFDLAFGLIDRKRRRGDVFRRGDTFWHPQTRSDLDSRGARVLDVAGSLRDGSPEFFRVMQRVMTFDFRPYCVHFSAAFNEIARDPDRPRLYPLPPTSSLRGGKEDPVDTIGYAADQPVLPVSKIDQDIERQIEESRAEARRFASNFALVDGRVFERMFEPCLKVSQQGAINLGSLSSFRRYVDIDLEGRTGYLPPSRLKEGEHRFAISDAAGGLALSRRLTSVRYGDADIDRENDEAVASSYALLPLTTAEDLLDMEVAAIAKLNVATADAVLRFKGIEEELFAAAAALKNAVRDHELACPDRPALLAALSRTMSALSTVTMPSDSKVAETLKVVVAGNEVMSDRIDATPISINMFPA